MTAALLASIAAAGIPFATGAEVAWWAYQHPAALPGIGADGTPCDRFLGAFIIGAMATIVTGSFGGAAVDRIERRGTTSPTWR
ncbi:hypothetical protein [Streptomyces xanthophaeus]|uniref:Uncharacterized protein n=1 Tax=Streptomyces xanthophaeus TaxID=67385 RepID=A0A919GX26_9ACTN|nr:hypothetical protein [Streptomyces xanthophaeus]GHI85529.1 hypothetical protein Sxan_28930 [Streptomyces xanthophaeus]